MSTSKDVARRAGVSQSTVSYVMSGKRPISEKTRRRVEAVMEELTFQPNAGARALASARTSVIGLVAPFGGTLDATGLLPFLETIASSARQRDHDVLLVTADEGPSALSRLAGRRMCDAIVVMEVQTHDERVAVAQGLGLPVIFIGIPADSGGLPCVDVDFEASGSLAVGELVDSGHDALVYVGHSALVVERDINYVARFQRGARRAAEAAGATLQMISPVEARADDVGRVAGVIVEAAARHGGRLGVVTPQTDLLQLLLSALGARGVDLGREVSVVGSCTDAAASVMVPALTNVSVEPRSVSRRVMDTVFAMLDGSDPSPPGVQLIQPHLTRRATTPAR